MMYYAQCKLCGNPIAYEKKGGKPKQCPCGGRFVQSSMRKILSSGVLKNVTPEQYYEFNSSILNP